eukprot:scaffold12332_cov58-Cyclotella_meneghiniana.AAC.2
MQNIHRGFEKLQARSSGDYFVYGWGKGGRACVGYTHNWYGPGGGLERTNRVSGAYVVKVDKKAEVFRLLYDWYGVSNDEELAIFHRNVPHNETNAWPTWSLKFINMPQRYGAKEFTFVEYDNDEILGYRIKATEYYTGSPDGKITHRNQLSRPPPVYTDESSDNDEDEADSEEEINEEENQDNMNGDEDEDPVSISQTFFGESDSNKGKRCRLRTPTSSPKGNDPFTNEDWAVVLNPSIITTVTDLTLHAQEFPSVDKITAFEFIAASDKWKEPDRALMAVFAVDQATAEAYAHWVEHRAKLIFNVPKRWQHHHLDTQYVKEELPIKHHGDFHRYITWTNKPAELATKLLTEWKVTERIKEVNTKRASPKSAMDFDTNMTDTDGATTQVTNNTSLAAAAAAIAANSTAQPNTSDQSATSDANVQPPPLNVNNATADDSDDEEDEASIDLLLDNDTDLLP